MFSWGGNPGVGSLHRLRDAVEHGWPAPLELEEHSHAGMAAAYAAGATNLPFGLVRGYEGTDLAERTRARLDHVPVHRRASWPRWRRSVPTSGSSTPSGPTEAGNVQLWGITGVQKEVVLASARSIVTVEEIVPRLEPRPGAIVLPAWTITAVSLAPGGAHPSYAHGYYDRDNAFYVRWDEISRDRDRFRDWMRRHVLETADVDGYHRALYDQDASAA